MAFVLLLFAAYIMIHGFSHSKNNAGSCCYLWTELHRKYEPQKLTTAKGKTLHMEDWI